MKKCSIKDLAIGETVLIYYHEFGKYGTVVIDEITGRNVFCNENYGNNKKINVFFEKDFGYKIMKLPDIGWDSKDNENS